MPSGMMSARVERSWPNFTNVGPRSSSALLRRTPKFGARSSLAPRFSRLSRRTSKTKPNPCLARTRAIWENRTRLPRRPFVRNSSGYLAPVTGPTPPWLGVLLSYLPGCRAGRFRLVLQGLRRYVHAADRRRGLAHRGHSGLGRPLRTRRRRPTIEEADPVLELLDAEEE